MINYDLKNHLLNLQAIKATLKNPGEEIRKTHALNLIEMAHLKYREICRVDTYKTHKKIEHPK